MIKVKTERGQFARFLKTHHGSMKNAWCEYRLRQLIGALKKGKICLFEYIKENGELRTAVGFTGNFEILVSMEGNQYVRYMEIFSDGHMEQRAFRIDRFVRFTHYRDNI